jgi:hypothetical protein
MAKKTETPTKSPGRELSKARKAAVQSFKRQLGEAKSATKSTNERIAASATRYFSQLGGNNPIGAAKINAWASHPKEGSSDWTEATARTPKTQKELAALVLSLLQHGAWGAVSATNADCRLVAKEWATLLGLPELDEADFRLLTFSDDPARDVPHMLEALMGGVFDPQISDPQQQPKRALLCVVAVTEPGIHNDSQGFDRLVNFIAQGGCYAIVNPFNPSFRPELAECVHMAAHYEHIYQESQGLVGKLRDRVAARVENGIQIARQRIKLLRPVFVEGRAAACRIFSPVVGAVARPVLCCVHHVASGYDHSRFGTMLTEGEEKDKALRLEMHVDDSPGRRPTDQAKRDLSMIREYCGDLIKGWVKSGRLNLPDKLESDTWEIEES